MSAACVTGLERSYAEISSNIKATLGILQGAVLFGVNPSRSWNSVDIAFDMVRNQSLCAMERTRRFYPAGAWQGLQLELCDLSVCEEMLAAYEAARNTAFHTVMRLRLDLFWETIPVLPPMIQPDDVFVPSMSHCNGVCDKFALGGRSGMRSYFVRKRWLSGVSSALSVNSEMLLRAIRKQTQIRFHRRNDWIFCKFGSRIASFRPWSECTRRIRARVRCEKLFCDWCGRGCRCVTAQCSASSQRQRICFQPNASTGKSTYSHRRDYVVPGAAQAFLVTTPENKSDSTV